MEKSEINCFGSQYTFGYNHNIPMGKTSYFSYSFKTKLYIHLSQKRNFPCSFLFLSCQSVSQFYILKIRLAQVKQRKETRIFPLRILLLFSHSHNILFNSCILITMQILGLVEILLTNKLRTNISFHFSPVPFQPPFLKVPRNISRRKL